jgi:tripartite-type tricarboxylate transporter receptor subunit TctC
MTITRRATLASLLALAGTARAQHSFSRTITIIVPFSAGGTLDVLARSLALGMEKPAGQSIVIDNKPGASGIIASEFVQNAAPDGHTLLFNSSGMWINQALRPKTRYDVLRDFTPISQVGDLLHNYVLVPARSPYRNLRQVLDAARAQPGKLSYATPGIGNSQHLFFEYLSAQAGGIKLVHVPYKGIPEQMTALIRGDVDLMSLNPLLARPQLRSGQVRAVAVCTPDGRRSPELPDVPEITEELPAFKYSFSRFGFFAPPRTPAPVAQALHAVVTTAMRDPRVRETFGSAGIELVGKGSQEFGATIAADIAEYRRIAAASKIQIDE